MGRLSEFSPIMQADMGKEDFRSVIRELIEEQYNGAWTVSAPTTKHGKIPVGAIFAWVRGGVIEMGDMLWFPWASKRNILEASIIFFHEIRKQAVVLEFARKKDEAFFAHIASYGLMRRVGHVHDIYPDQPAILFQTRSIKE